MELLKWDAKHIHVASGWHVNCSDMYACSYYDARFANSKFNRYAQCSVSTLQYIVRDFVQGPPEKNLEMYVRISGEECVANGSCTFLDKYKNTQVRLTTRRAGPEGCHSIHMFFFDCQMQIIGTASWFMHVGEVPYIYHPNIYQISAEACPIKTTVNMLRQADITHAKWKIQAAVTRCLLDPTYLMCRRRLMRDFDKLFKDEHTQ